jgi:membrane protein implicated in regulation of membrane protease activity
MTAWSSATGWWIVAGMLVAAELASGTFYLLMLAVGCIAGALAAHLGIASTGQLLAAALVGGLAVVAWHLRRRQHPAAPPASRNPDVNLDIGQTVHVDAWSAEGTTQVHYRGAPWQARFIGNPPPQLGRHVIAAIEGSCLLLDR